MSIARVHTVLHANKDQGKCERDGTPLPKGSAYRWWTVGYRSRLKHRRCMNPRCTPRLSELESSLVSSVMAAREDAETTLSSLMVSDPGDPADMVQQVQDALAGVADAADEVAQQYRDQDEQFGGGGNTDSAERADTLEEAANTLRDWQPDSDAPDGCEEHDQFDDACDACGDEWANWLDSVLDGASDALSEMEV